MSANRLRRDFALAVNDRLFYGWVIVFVAAMGFLASGPGQSHTFSVFVQPIAADLGISRTGVAAAYAFATLLAALGLPYMGRLVDRYGPRRMILIVSALLGLACIAFGGVTGGLWLGLGFAALRFLGQGSVMLNCSNLVAQWFSRTRGFAMSLMVLGFAASMAVHPPLSQWLIETVGWRQAWIWLGVITWVLLLPLVLALVHNRPEDLGLLPDGAAAAAGDDNQAVTDSTNLGLSLPQALRTSAFYIIAAGLFSISMLVTSLHFFQVSIFEQHGLNATIASRVFPVSAVTMVVAMPLFGMLLDRFRTEYIFAAAQIVTSASLISAALVQDLPTALAYGVIFGVNNAATLSLFVYMWPRYFGRRHLGSIQGAGQMIGVVGASLGALPLGAAFDLLGSYTEVLLALAVFPLACAVLALFLRPPDLTAYAANP